MDEARVALCSPSSPRVVKEKHRCLPILVANCDLLSLMLLSQSVRVAGRAIALQRISAAGAWNASATVSQRLMSSGHEVDIMDKKLYPKGYHPPTYDEAILPSGSWHDNNAALQVKYNRQLALGLLFFISTVYYMYICPEVDFVLAPKSIGVNPPKFSVLPPKEE